MALPPKRAELQGSLGNQMPQQLCACGCSLSFQLNRNPTLTDSHGTAPIFGWAITEPNSRRTCHLVSTGIPAVELQTSSSTLCTNPLQVRSDDLLTHTHEANTATVGTRIGTRQLVPKDNPSAVGSWRSLPVGRDHLGKKHLLPTILAARADLPHVLCLRDLKLVWDKSLLARPSGLKGSWFYSFLRLFPGTLAQNCCVTHPYSPVRQALLLSLQFKHETTGQVQTERDKQINVVAQQWQQCWQVFQSAL